jgi:hypothetical protein
MLGNYYGGIGHALILDGDSVRVISEASTESLAPERHPRRVGERPDGELSVDDLERLLQHGDIVDQREDDAGRQIVTLSNGLQKVDALFEKRAARGFYPEVAAYRLDRMLDLAMVPAAVVRDVDGDDGSLQFLPVDVIDEAQRSESGRGASAYCPLEEQWQAMYLFDAFIYNEGRSQQRMIYSLDNWQLMLTGHDRAFATTKGKPRHLERAPIKVNGAWSAALQKLDDASLSSQLGDVLDAKRRRALLARRDQLLKDR